MNEESTVALTCHRPVSARDIAAVLFRQRAYVISTFAVVFMVIIAYGICFPSYRAEMKIMVGKGRADPPVVPQPTAFDYSRYEVSEEEINSEVQLLQDTDVLRPVVVRTGLNGTDHRPLWLGSADGGEARIARAVRRLGSRLEVTPLRKTRLISVAYESDTPLTAARVLRELASAYLQKHLAVHRPPGQSAFFQQQSDNYSKALGVAERRLMTQINEKGTGSPSLQRDLVIQKLTEAEAYCRQVSLQKSETQERIRILTTQLAELPERRTTQVRSGDNPELLQQLKSTLLNLELRRIELLTKYQANYRLVQEIEQQIADTRAAIAAESLAPVREQTTDTEPRYDWAASEVKKAEADLAVLQARATAAADILHSYQETVQRLGMQAIQHDGLIRQAKVAEENYLLYVRKREEARIGDALDEQRIVNVAIVQEPVVPALPKWSLANVITLGLVLAALFSAGLGVAADYLDPGYHTPEEVTVSLGIPALASLPRKAA